MTSIYYPKQNNPDTWTERSYSLACPDDTLLPGAQPSTAAEDEFAIPPHEISDPPATPAYAEAAPTAEAATGHGHKRTISDLVSRAEREVRGRLIAAMSTSGIPQGLQREVCVGLAGPSSLPSAVEVVNTMLHEVDSDLAYSR